MALINQCGLLMPGLYSETVLGPAMKGQDLVTLLIMPVLVTAMLAARRGSDRALMIWIGLLAYVLYTYTGAAFAYRFNVLFLVYVALFSLSTAALVVTGSCIDLRRMTRIHAPRRAAAIYLGFIALMLVVSELGQIVSALIGGTVPDLIRRSEGAGNFVYVLDLGIVAPLAVLTAFGLWRRAPWADLIAAVILIKATTMGVALVSMSWFSVRSGQPFEAQLTIVYFVMAVLGLGMSIWFFMRTQASASAK